MTTGFHKFEAQKQKRKRKSRLVWCMESGKLWCTESGSSDADMVQDLPGRTEGACVVLVTDDGHVSCQ